MVRAAAKNFKNVTIITNKNDYDPLIEELEKNKGKTSLKFRIYVIKSIWIDCLLYAMIANWFNNKLNIQFPERKTILEENLRN